MTIKHSRAGQALHDERLKVIISMRRHGVEPTAVSVDAVARIILTMRDHVENTYC